MKERKHEVLATVRLVNKDGDVLWSTTQESNGAFSHGASADVAEKIAKQLVAELLEGEEIGGEVIHCGREASFDFSTDFRGLPIRADAPAGWSTTSPADGRGGRFV